MKPLPTVDLSETRSFWFTKGEHGYVVGHGDNELCRCRDLETARSLTATLRVWHTKQRKGRP